MCTPARAHVGDLVQVGEHAVPITGLVLLPGGLVEVTTGQPWERPTVTTVPVDGDVPVVWTRFTSDGPVAA